MKRIVAPEKYVGQPRDVRVFLAGGITGAPEWQDEIVGLLQDTSLVLFDPRRKEYTNHVQEQIEWEFRMLHMADAVSFWFPSPAKCMITLFELGAWSRQGKPIFVGVDPAYERRQDVEIQMALARPDIKIVYSLADLAQQIRKHFKEKL